MISSQPAIPLLVHEDCMGDIKTDLASQQAILSEIAYNTNNTNMGLSSIRESLVNIEDGVSNVVTNTSSIKTSSSNTATATSALYSSVGTTADGSSENTVIGLLKSISNKITTF